MALSKQQILVLYALGILHQRLSEKCSQHGLEACITKAAFIRLVRSIHLFKKKERALYKNLEILETRKYVSYEGKKLLLSQLGRKEFLRKTYHLAPFLQVQDVVEREDVLKYTKVQTSFKSC